jgi:hypothetical protein
MPTGTSSFLFLTLLTFYGSLFQSHDAKIRDILDRIASKYSIELTYSQAPLSSWEDGVTWRTLHEGDFKAFGSYLKLFDQEFNKYPAEFVHRTNLKKIVFVKRLTVSSQERAALPDYYKEILYLDIYVGDFDTTYQKHVIHHEFYHMIEQEFNGDAYDKDTLWSALNPPDFRYGAGGSNARSSNMFPLTHPRTGFINLYSASGLEEEKAEIFAVLFLPEEHAKVSAWMQKDQILANKVNAMKKSLLEKSGGLMNDNFWKRVVPSP